MYRDDRSSLKMEAMIIRVRHMHYLWVLPAEVPVMARRGKYALELTGLFGGNASPAIVILSTPPLFAVSVSNNPYTDDRFAT